MSIVQLAEFDDLLDFVLDLLPDEVQVFHVSRIFYRVVQRVNGRYRLLIGYAAPPVRDVLIVLFELF